MSVQLRTELKQLKFLFMITSKALGLGMHKMWICNDFTLNPVCQNKKKQKKKNPNQFIAKHKLCKQACTDAISNIDTQQDLSELCVHGCVPLIID